MKSLLLLSAALVSLSTSAWARPVPAQLLGMHR